MRQRGTAYPFRPNRHIGGLAGHADDEREVSKIQVVRFGLVREVQSTGWFALFPGIAVVEVGITEGKDRVHQSPGTSNGQDSQRSMDYPVVRRY